MLFLNTFNSLKGGSMMYLLKRHPFAVSAFFRRSLVLTWAFPPEALEPLLAPGLALDTFGGRAFLAVALVQTERMRPSFLPAVFGCDFFLSGYRLFVRKRTERGLQILHSDTNRRLLVVAGNLFTRYHYRLCRAEIAPEACGLHWRIRTRGGADDLDLLERWSVVSPVPAGSPFATERDARRFAGPLPFTYSYEPESHSIVAVRGIRREWNPTPADVAVRRAAFLEREPFLGAAPVLAAAFTVRAVPYQWTRGVRTRLEAA
jgi:hypothetical protein